MTILDPKTFIETVDVVKVMFGPGFTPTEGDALEVKIERAAVNAIKTHFGVWKLGTEKPIRVDVLEFATTEPHKVLFQRYIVKGKMRRMI